MTHAQPRRDSRKTPTPRWPTRSCSGRSKFSRRNFIARRQHVADKLPEFEALRDAARDIKNHTLAHLDLYLEAYERRVVAQGGHVHFARDGGEARAIVARYLPRGSAPKP